MVIEFIVKHLEEMKEEIKQMKAEKLIYIIRNEGINIENEDTLWEFVKDRIKEMKKAIYEKENNKEKKERFRKMRRILLDNIQIKKLTQENFKEYIEEIEPADISCSSTTNSTEGRNIWKQIQEMILDNNNNIEKIVDFVYMGSEQTFTPILSGRYKLEVWGAQGGNETYGGKGAYASGVINLNKNQSVKVYVGGQGSGNSQSSIGAGGYNILPLLNNYLINIMIVWI